jgi:hypothetical protein
MGGIHRQKINHKNNKTEEKGKSITTFEIINPTADSLTKGNTWKTLLLCYFQYIYG